jgi:hypothetical protein
MPKTQQIAFTTNMRGTPLAYRVSMQQMRHFPIGVEEAKLMISLGRAVEVKFRPFGKDQSK